MFIIAGIALFIIIVGILIVAATKPNTFRIERSATIHTTPTKLFAYINDLSKWQEWSPWEKLDRNVQRTLSGPAKGVGAAYAWEGNRKVGMGRMEIMESKGSSKIVMKLEFFKPFKASNTAEFTLAKKGESTEIIWVMFGPQRYSMKVMGMLMDCDAMVGKQFAEGLTNLKALVEK
ncbi:MAG TPA: SRPBCC family protein [Methylophilaceae bacterium]